jgi:hypothetical protein
VATGALHLSGVVLLAPYLTPQNAGELIAAAAHRNKVEIEQLLAERFPQPEVLALAEALPAPSPCGVIPQLSTETAASSEPARSELSAPGRINDQRPQLAQVAPRRFALQLTLSQELHAKLRYAQELLSHQVSSGDLAEVLERALDALIPQLERRKFAGTTRPRAARPRSTTNPRYVPAHVKRAVWERDGGQCTFVSETGRRCTARTLLEFDHVDPVARGGRATVEGMRLRCRAHNQYAAERTFGIEFMRHKRATARAATGTVANPGEREQAAHARAAAKEKAAEVIPWLRALGIRGDQARHAAALCEAIPDAPLEERVRRALRSFGVSPSPPA